jgi:hypothetical protein
MSLLTQECLKFALSFLWLYILYAIRSILVGDGYESKTENMGICSLLKKLLDQLELEKIG